ncbi:ABC transporter permease [Thermus islandicus]|uniref:ABC transporter permease n=1 Tax=Thermus islandicus TaxID=540988 RepID=UPI0003B7745B|nr:FtsX-like permease family protein [Thermus islandicus]
MTLAWLRGLLTRRPLRVWGAATGVALTIAFLACLGAFITRSTATMTQRAVEGVAVDWQVLLAPNADPGTVRGALQAVGVKALELVGYADVAGFSARTGGTVQTTGAGKVLGLSSTYAIHFPKEIRPLVGSAQGVLLAQQTAANLHVAVGDTVVINRLGLPPVSVRVAGIVDLPEADSLFQAVGAPKGLAPQAPPDNVLLLPEAQWHALFDPQRTVRPDSVREQFHVRLSAPLSKDPGAAYVQVQQLANHVEVKLAGGAVIGNNLAARLDGVRADALYAQALFLFLGVPGAILAALLTLSMASASWGERRRETALLRMRGAGVRRVLGMASLEAGWVAFAGLLGGLALAWLAERVALPSGSSLRSVWTLLAGAFGVLLAVSVVLVPTLLALRNQTVNAARQKVGRASAPLWQRLYLDLGLLALSGALFWRSAAGGYQLVLAPEGVAKSSVQYESFIAPLALWVGATLLAVRLLDWALRRRSLTPILRPLAGNLAPSVSATLERQRSLLSQGTALAALAVAFAVSTSIFNATYAGQSRVDALLTNGADVTVTGTAAHPAGSRLAALRAIPGVAAAQPLQHRFAYVGNDLQDLFGVDAAHLTETTRLVDAYFRGVTAQQALQLLRSRPDALFVSQETANDYQLKVGDPVRLRLLDARDHQYHVVPFTFVGVVREFPTAPKDSFLVANAGYVASQTHADAAEVVLLRVNGDRTEVAARAAKIVRDLPGATVSELGAVQQRIASSLTAVNAAGLSRLELGFAVLLLAAATGLVLLLGLTERRRNFTVLIALGAKPKQLGAFLWGEGLVVAGAGSLAGLLIGLGVAQLLVKLLDGVFDPAPERLAIPWGYLAALALAAFLSTVLAVNAARAASGKRLTEVLRSA